MPRGTYTRTKESMKKQWETKRKNGTDKHSEETKNKISIAHVGKKRTDEHKLNMSKSLKGKKSWSTGLTKNTDKRLEKMGKNVSKANSGENHWNFGNTYSENYKNFLSKLHFGFKHSKETKEKMRENALNRILKNGTMINEGKNEKELLDEQEIKDNCKIDRNFKIIGYKPDGYCHETNTIYEVYEKFHDKQVFDDLKRENEICNKLGCDFIIIYDITH